MDLDTSYIEPLLDDWLEELQSIIKAQESFIKAKDEFYMPFVAIPIPIINAIFKITEYLHLGPDTRYIAIHLYDKFMCSYFWEVYRNADQTESSWSQVCKKVASQSKLYLMSCLQLANKMDSHFNKLRISQVLGILRCIDKKSEYTPNVIFLSEYKVFKTVGFRMPFYTPLNCVEILLAATGLKDTPNMQELTINLLDLVYLQIYMVIEGGNIFSFAMFVARTYSKNSTRKEESYDVNVKYIIFGSFYRSLWGILFMYRL
ncbi:uncharacterized protein LOC117217005 isoform X2 [Bombus bifarius]|uniref:Uncharacterized protein LOC117217005 isoform X2 n=1 Tax=Bombus bifarius TaxID=103933 RepID=A0A6P8N1Y7_9HYME|nr:uncharacterized protein LOC117217005 isoform X2 [Bombus bifarius]